MVAGFLGSGALFLSYKSQDFILVSTIALSVALVLGAISSYFWHKIQREQLLKHLKAIEWSLRGIFTLVFLGIGIIVAPSGKLMTVIGIYFLVIGFLASGLGVFGYMVSRK